MKAFKPRAAAAVLAALMVAMPLSALAAETAPLNLKTQEDATVPACRRDKGRLNKFGKKRSYLGVKASPSWLYQVWLDDMSFNVRLYTQDGAGVTFEEKLVPASTEGLKDIRLCMRAGSREGGLMLQMDQRALEVLDRVGITEIALADIELYIQEVYSVKDLLAMREALALTKGEELCLTGLDQPVTIVGEDGVRRVVTTK